MQASLSTSCHMCHTCICLRYMLSAHDKDADNCAQCNLQEHAIVSYLCCLLTCKSPHAGLPTQPHWHCTPQCLVSWCLSLDCKLGGANISLSTWKLGRACLESAAAWMGDHSYTISRPGDGSIAWQGQLWPGLPGRLQRGSRCSQGETQGQAVLARGTKHKLALAPQHYGCQVLRITVHASPLHSELMECPAPGKKYTDNGCLNLLCCVHIGCSSL